MEKMCYIKKWWKAGVYAEHERFSNENRHIIAIPANRESERMIQMKKTKSADSKNKRKGTQINIRLPQSEKKKLNEKAVKSGLGLSEYIRMLLSGNSGRWQNPEMVGRCAVLCQDILNIIEEKYSCEDNSLLEEKVEKVWGLL